MAVDRTVSMTMNGSSAGVPAAAKLRWRADRHVMLIETTSFGIRLIKIWKTVPTKYSVFKMSQDCLYQRFIHHSLKHKMKQEVLISRKDGTLEVLKMEWKLGPQRRDR